MYTMNGSASDLTIIKDYYTIPGCKEASSGYTWNGFLFSFPELAQVGILLSFMIQHMPRWRTQRSTHV